MLSINLAELDGSVDHPSAYRELLRVAVIQINLDANKFWKNGPPLEPDGAKRAKEMLKRGFQMLNSGFPDKPHIILLPELSVPHSFVGELKRLLRIPGHVNNDSGVM